MILSNVNIGSGPSAGDGDPLRSAFTIINNNFQTIENNVNALTNSVNSVAGRTGNVILTVNDIVGLSSTYTSQANITAANVGMKGYVDAKITANIALLVNLAPTSLDTIRELADAIGDDPNFAVNVALSVSSANTKMRGYIDGQITAANARVTAANVGIIGYVDLANTIQSGQVGAANLAIIAANLGMKGYVDSVATLSIYSNVNAKAYTESMGYQNFGNVNVAAYVTTANSAILGYIDLANTIQSGQVGAANLAITAANLGMKGYVDSVASQSIYGNSNVKSYLTGGFDGNIIPSANTIYSLGSVTNQWRDLFVSNNTIYVGGVPLGIDATGNLTVNGNVIPTISYVNTVVANVTVDLSSYALNANVTAANVGLKGYVDQANTIQGAQLTSANLGVIGYIDLANTIQSAQVGAANLAITSANVGLKGYVDSQSFYSNVKVATYLPTYDGNIAANISKAGYTWTFGTDAVLTLPSGATILESGYGSAGAIRLKPNGGTSTQYLEIAPTTVDGNHVHLMAGSGTELFLGDDNHYVKLANTGGVVINSNDSAGNTAQWTFGTDGTTTFPTNISIDYSGGNVLYPRIIAGSGTTFSVQGQGNIGSAALAWTADPNAASQYASVGVARVGDNLAKVVLLAMSDSADVATAKIWQFNETGTTQFPNSLILAPVSQSITMQSDQYSQLMWENANLTVAPNMAINSNFYVAQNNATLDIAKRDGSGTQLTKSWYWNADGNLKLPSGGYILNSDDSIYGAGSSYSNVEVATYLPTYSGNIANIRLGVSGVLTFPDGTTQTTAATGGGSSYGNANVTAYTVSMGFTNYSNVNVSALITTNGLTNYSNVNAKAYAETMGYQNFGNVNVAAYVTTANSAVIGYVDNAVSTANVGVIGYIDRGNTIVTAGITTANVGMKGYVDAGIIWSISASGSSDYVFSGPGIVAGNTNDPVLYLYKGLTYTFINTTGGSHPFAIRVSNGGADYTSGVSGSQTGTQTFTVPMDAPSTLYYQCTIHGGMGNTIYIGSIDNNYSNVNVKAYTETMGFQNYSNVNVAALITTNGLTNYSNVNVIAYLAGNITVGNIAGSVNGYAIGYRDVPQITVANLTLIASDAGKHYYGANTNPTTITIPTNANVAFGNGTAISIVNQGTGNITVASDTGVSLYLAGNSTAGSRTLTSYGMATLIKVQINTWFINGTGVV